MPSVTSFSSGMPWLWTSSQKPSGPNRSAKYRALAFAAS